MTYEKTAPGTWTYSAQLPAADYSVAGGDVVPAAITGTMTFDANGNLATVNGTNVGTGVGDVSSIPLDFTPAGPPVSALADGAAGLTISWNLLSSAGNAQYQPGRRDFRDLGNNHPEWLHDRRV